MNITDVEGYFKELTQEFKFHKDKFLNTDVIYLEMQDGITYEGLNVQEDTAWTEDNKFIKVLVLSYEWYGQSMEPHAYPAIGLSADLKKGQLKRFITTFKKRYNRGENKRPIWDGNKYVKEII